MQPHRSIQRSILLLAGLFQTTAQVSAAFLDFNNPAQYDTGSGGNFQEIITGPADAFSWSSSNGVGGVPGIIHVRQPEFYFPTVTAETTSMYLGESFDLSGAGASGTISLFFQANQTGSVFSNAKMLMIGFAGNPTDGFDPASTTTNLVGAAMVSTGFQSKLESVVRSTNAPGQPTASQGTLFNALPLHWYELKATFTHDGSAFDYTASLDDRGLDGLAAAIPLLSVAGTFDVDALENDTDLYGGFYAVNYGNVVAGQPKFFEFALSIDNFSAVSTPGVPEPSIGALLLLGFLGWLGCRRRTVPAGDALISQHQ